MVLNWYGILDMKNNIFEPVTESHNKLALGLDTLSPKEILSILHQGQLDAAGAVNNAFEAIEDAALLLSKTIENNGNIIYVAAGSSALMALADGLELQGTFGIPNERVKIIIAGGHNTLSNMTGKVEDNTNTAVFDLKEAKISNKDCVVCVSASGTTPYVVAALKSANMSGANTIAIANNLEALLFKTADIAIHLDTPAEIISGSTRLGAATAQKIALNMMSTLMAIHLGHVHDGYMVNVKADNEKLKLRATKIVVALAKCKEDKAQKYIEMADGSVKLAILLATGSVDKSSAKEILENNGQKLRPSLSVSKGSYLL